jgi:hypothetical protein
MIEERSVTFLDLIELGADVSALTRKPKENRCPPIVVGWRILKRMEGANGLTLTVPRSESHGR